MRFLSLVLIAVLIAVVQWRHVQGQNSPTGQPTSQPTSRPTNRPTSQPTSRPTNRPTSQPTSRPTIRTSSPTRPPTKSPTIVPTVPPTIRPTLQDSGTSSSSDVVGIAVGVTLGALFLIAVIICLVYFGGMKWLSGMCGNAGSGNNNSSPHFNDPEASQGKVGQPNYQQLPKNEVGTNYAVFDETKFDYNNKRYLSSNQLALKQILTKDVRLFSNSGARGVDATSDFPLLSLILSEVSQVTKSGLSEYFEEELPEQMVYLRASTINCLIFLTEVHVRGSILCSSDPNDLTFLTRSYSNSRISSLTDNLAYEMRTTVDKHWKLMFRDILQMPSHLLSKEGEIPAILKLINSNANPTIVKEELIKFFAENEKVAKKLIEIVVMIALSPKLVRFAAGQVFFESNEPLKAIAETGGGKKVKGYVRVVPAIVTVNGTEEIFKPAVYKINI